MSYSAKTQVKMLVPVGINTAWASLTSLDMARAARPWGPIPGVVAVHGEPPGFFDEPGKSRFFENTDGSTVVETIKELDPPHRLAYTVTGLTNSFRLLTTGASACFEFEPVSDHETRATWTYSWHAHNVLTLPLVWLVVHTAFRPFMRRMIERISRQAQCLIQIQSAA